MSDASDDRSLSPSLPQPSRRAFLGTVALGAVGTLVTGSTFGGPAFGAQQAAAGFTLPELPYAEDALEPVIDAATMNIHRTKHHNAYVTNLNKTLAGAFESHPELRTMSLEDLCRRVATLPESIRTSVRNNGGGHWNHAMFWKWMRPVGGPAESQRPSDALAAAIAKSFGSMDAFKEQFAAAGASRFGSGWAWLCQKADGSLAVCSTANQDNPLMEGIVDCIGRPLLGCDVWEHAYYLRYQNRRGDYLKAWWDVVNWSEVSRGFTAG